MAEIKSELIYEILKQLQEGQRLIREDIHDIKVRLTSLENKMAQIHLDMANHSERMDRIDARLARVEKRLELQ